MNILLQGRRSKDIVNTSSAGQHQERDIPVSIREQQLEYEILANQFRRENMSTQQENETLQLIIELETRINTLETTNAQTLAEKQATQTANYHLQIENRMLTNENNKLNNEVKSLENRVTQLMSEKGRFNNEMTSLKDRNAQLMIEKASLKYFSQGEEGLTDLKYWSVTHAAITTTNTRLGEGGWGKVEVGYFHG